MMTKRCSPCSLAAGETTFLAFFSSASLGHRRSKLAFDMASKHTSLGTPPSANPFFRSRLLLRASLHRRSPTAAVAASVAAARLRIQVDAAAIPPCVFTYKRRDGEITEFCSLVNTMDFIVGL